jgi:SHS2 domain-containing protein
MECRRIIEKQKTLSHCADCQRLMQSYESLPQRVPPPARRCRNGMAATATPAFSLAAPAAPEAPPSDDDETEVPVLPPAKHAKHANQASSVAADTHPPGRREEAELSFATLPATATGQWEYLDHPADVQIHAWGVSLPEAFENCAVAMFNYMTPLTGVAEAPDVVQEFECDGVTNFLQSVCYIYGYMIETKNILVIASCLFHPIIKLCMFPPSTGHDLDSLLFNWLDCLLFRFATEFFVCKRVRIVHFDDGACRLRAQGYVPVLLGSICTLPEPISNYVIFVGALSIAFFILFYFCNPRNEIAGGEKSLIWTSTSKAPRSKPSHIPICKCCAPLIAWIYMLL